MKKLALALAALTASAPAMAGVYVNVESNASYEFSGKLGASVAANEKLDVYGEVSFITDEDADNSYGTKIGAKYKF